MPPVAVIDPDRLLALGRWLRNHHQVVSHPELAALGIPRHFANNRVRDGRWQRVYDGVFYACTGPISLDARCAAVLAALGEDAALDDETAAWLWGFSQATAPRLVRAVVPHRGSERGLAGARVRQSVAFAPRSSRERRRLRALRIEHAVVAMAVRRPRRARGLLSAAVQEGLATPDLLKGSVLINPTIAGHARLLQIISDIAGGSRSELEGEVLDGVRRSGLPEPERNYPLLIEGRRLWLDMCYPALRIAIEIDGKAYHLFSEDWEDDLERQNDIVLDGWLMIRFSTRAIREDLPGCLHRIRAATALRTAELARTA